MSGIMLYTIIGKRVLRDLQSSEIGNEDVHIDRDEDLSVAVNADSYKYNIVIKRQSA